VQVGEGVTGYAVGDLVAAETTYACCGACEFCRRGDTGICHSRRSLGWSADGYWAEYVVVNALFSHKLDPQVNPRGAAVLEPFVCGLKALTQRIKITPGDLAVVWGPGPIGQGAALAARLAGARVVVVGTEHSRSRLEVASRLGAFRTWVSGVDDVVAEVKALSEGYGAHLCIDASGSLGTFQQAMACVRRLGQILLLSVPHSPELVMNPGQLLDRQPTIVASIGTNPTSWNLAVRLLNSGSVNLDLLASDVFPLEQWQEAMARTKRHEGMKILLRP